VSEAERVWQLVRGDEVLAELAVTSADYPWLKAEVRPAAAFAEVRPLFDDEIAGWNSSMRRLNLGGRISPHSRGGRSRDPGRAASS
jgi:hypothetical protein